MWWALVLALALAACARSPAPVDGATPWAEVAAAAGVIGDWRWGHAETTGGTRRTERERWQLERVGLTGLSGQYQREVEIEAEDGKVFLCNQRPRYVLRTRYQVVGGVDHDGVWLQEAGYQTEPSPCEGGLRQLGRYRAHVDDYGLLVMVGDASVARLATGDGPSVLAMTPTVPTDLDGAWTWQAESWMADGRLQREAERWQLERHGDDLSGTYQRVVTILEPSGVAQPCAGAAWFDFVDRYRLEGRLTRDGWRLREVEVEAGAHPCLAGTPTRTLDEAALELEGEYLVLLWRGPRRQVLGRPAPPPPGRGW